MNSEDRTRITAYYDAFLPHLARDHVRENKRLNRAKVKLGTLIKPGDTVLDLGCGTGLTSKFMAQLGAKVTAVDISPKLIEFAKANSAHENVEYFVADITDCGNLKREEKAWQRLPKYISYNEVFDGIVLVDVFEHIPAQDIPKLTVTISQHSNSSTWLFLNIPDERYQRAAKERIPERLQIEDNGYSIGEIQELFRGIDFEVVDMNIYGIDADCQYNMFVFRRKEILEKVYEVTIGNVLSKT